MNSPYIVVGAGASGLGCAIGLAETAPVIVVDRLASASGASERADPAVHRQIERAKQLGVVFRLGASAIRWSDRRLLVTGYGTCETIAARHLFFAGGLRPSTAAELALTGQRPPGVLSAIAAERLLRAADLPPWKTVAVIGDGAWASAVAGEARRLNMRVVAVGRGTTTADEHCAMPARWAVSGTFRVSALEMVYADASGSRRVRVACDAIVLAGAPVPVRNVDGAVMDPADGVTYVQPVAPECDETRITAATRLARAWLQARLVAGEQGEADSTNRASQT